MVFLPTFSSFLFCSIFYIYFYAVKTFPVFSCVFLKVFLPTVSEHFSFLFFFYNAILFMSLIDFNSSEFSFNNHGKGLVNFSSFIIISPRINYWVIHSFLPLTWKSPWSYFKSQYMCSGFSILQFWLFSFHIIFDSW